MTPNNFYPNLPILPYQKTSVVMSQVIEYALTLIPIYGIEPVRTAYCIFRNEAANGSAGVNNNYAGIQGDNAAWVGLTGIVGTTVLTDSGGAERRFVCFDENGYQTCFNFLCMKAKDRGIYIGGTTHLFTHVNVTTPAQLATAYNTEWSRQPITQQSQANFESLYHSATINIV